MLQPLLLGIREIAGKSPVCRVDEQIQILSDFGQIDETPRVAGAVSLTWAGVLRVTAGLHRGELDLVMAGKRWRNGFVVFVLRIVLFPREMGKTEAGSVGGNSGDFGATTTH